MADLNITSDIGYRNTGRAMKRLLTRGQYKMCAAMFGQAWTLGKNQGDTIKMRRYESLPRAVAPLAEGVRPAGNKLVKTDVTMTLQQFGAWVPLSDKMADNHEDNVFQETFDLCGEQMGESIEVITISGIKAGSTVFYAANAGSRTNVNSPAVAGDFKRIFRAFENNKATYVSKKIKASAMISTEPIAEAYVVFGHTDCKADLESLPGWIPKQNYADSDKLIHPKEVGSLGEFRFVLTPLFEPWQSVGATSQDMMAAGDVPTAPVACDVYPLIVISENAYGVVRLQAGGNAKLPVTPTVYNPRPVPGNELGQEGFVSWKTQYVCGIQNHAWIARLEVAVTAVPE